MADLTTIVYVRTLDGNCTTLKTFSPNGQTYPHLRKRVNFNVS